jgi:hypothetical protein
VLELLLCLLPRVAPVHTGWFGEVRLCVVSDLGRSAERSSGEALGAGDSACGYEGCMCVVVSPMLG